MKGRTKYQVGDMIYKYEDKDVFHGNYEWTILFTSTHILVQSDPSHRPLAEHHIEASQIKYLIRTTANNFQLKNSAIFAFQST